MKRITLLLMAGMMVLALVACDFGTGTVSAPPAAAFQDDAAAQDGANPAGSAFDVGSVSAGGLQTATAQEFTIDFNNGVVDASSASSAITVFPVTDADNAFTAWTRGTALAISTSVRDNLDGSSTVTVTFDGSAIVTNRLELVVGASLTANNGARTFNQDGDDLPGEAEDDFIQYLTVTDTGVTGFTNATTGAARTPRGKFDLDFFEDAALTVSVDGLLDQATLPTKLYLRFTSDSGATAANYDGFAVPTSDVVKLYQRDGADWDEVSATFTRESAGVWSMTPSGGFVDLKFYRVAINPLWQEAQAWNGYVHRLNAAGFGGTNTTDQVDRAGESIEWIYGEIRVDSGDDGRTAFDDTNVTGADATVVLQQSGSIVSGGYVQVDFSDDTNLGASGLIAASNAAELVQLTFDPDNVPGSFDSGNERVVGVTEVVKIDEQEYVFVFGSLGKVDADPFNLDDGGYGIRIEIFSGAFTDDQGTPAVTTDDLLYTGDDGLIIIDYYQSPS